MPSPVVNAVTDYLKLEARIGGYEAATEKAEELDRLYDDVAGLIGASRDEIAIVENATVAWDQAFYALSFQPGDRILTAQAEYAANYIAFLQRARKDGIIIDIVPNDEQGALDVTALENMIDKRTKLIAITWIPTNGGLVNPAAAIGAVAEKYGIPYLIDACQAVGQMPVDVQELRCDFLSATGRKFLRAPRGTGFLYVRNSILDKLEPAMIDLYAASWVSRNEYVLRPDARRFENWENAYALRLGLKSAIQYAEGFGLTAIQKRCWSLAAKLREALLSIPKVTLHDTGGEKCAIVTFSLPHSNLRELARQLRADQINVSVSSPSSTRIDAETRNLPDLLRASPHYYNNEQEIERFTNAIARA